MPTICFHRLFAFQPRLRVVPHFFSWGTSLEACLSRVNMLLNFTCLQLGPFGFSTTSWSTEIAKRWKFPFLDIRRCWYNWSRWIWYLFILLDLSALKVFIFMGVASAVSRNERGWQFYFLKYIFELLQTRVPNALPERSPFSERNVFNVEPQRFEPRTTNALLYGTFNKSLGQGSGER